MPSAIGEHKIVPDVLDESWDFQLEVKYSNDVVNYGNELTPTKGKRQPDVSWKADDGAYYTLLMIDPDAPARDKPKNREWLHWLVVNIQGSNVNEGYTIVEYVGAAPPKSTGFHRYVIILFKQPSKLKFEEKVIKKTVASGRAQFSTKKFAIKYNLGIPIAGNFFQAQYDKTCDEIYKQFK